MPKYRILKSTGRSAHLSATWIEKPTDQEAVATACESLGPHDSAEVWGERELVAHLAGTKDGAEGRQLGRLGRSLTSRPLGRHLLAGLVTTTGIALVLASLNGRGAETAPAKHANAIVIETLPDVPIAKPVSVQEDEAVPENLPEVQAPPAPVAGKPKLHRTHRGATEAAARHGGASLLFPAGTRPQTNVYALMASGFVQGGN